MSPWGRSRRYSILRKLRRLRYVRFWSLADIRIAKSHVCFASKSGHVRCTWPCLLRANSGHFDLFDDFVGARENWWREGQIERFRGFEINHEFELAGLQHGQVCGICAFKDTGDEVTSLTIRLR